MALGKSCNYCLVVLVGNLTNLPTGGLLLKVVIWKQMMRTLLSAPSVHFFLQGRGKGRRFLVGCAFTGMHRHEKEAMMQRKKRSHSLQLCILHTSVLYSTLVSTYIDCMYYRVFCFQHDTWLFNELKHLFVLYHLQ